MYFIFKILFALSILTSLSFSNDLVSKNLYDKYIAINKGSYKVLEFEKMIKNIKVSDAESLEVDFLDSKNKPLQAIKIFSKKLGHSNILITFEDTTSLHVDINVTENLTNIIEIAKEISSKLVIKQTNGKIILKGFVPNMKAKEKILDLFSKAGVDLKTSLVDLVELENPDKMIRVKLYAVEINNDKGKDLKNNWFVSSKNYMEVKNTDGTYQNYPLNDYGVPTVTREVYDTDPNSAKYGTVINKVEVPVVGSVSDYQQANNQRNTLVNGAIDNLMANAVSLTGGLTGAANYLGKYFNVGLTLNYLSSQGVANILDETTLLTLENKKANFLAGGTIYIKISTTTDQGVPTTQVRDIKYGLQLEIKAQNIVNDKFISLDIVTKSTGVDFANRTDGIPNFTEKSIHTNVVVGDKSTIVLGGLINRDNAKDIDKIPVLGDIPVLGFLFTSKSFKEGKSELVFFITPEVVDPHENSQLEEFEQKTAFRKTIDKRFGKDFVDSFDEDKKKKKEKEAEESKPKAEVETQKKMTNEELHKARVNYLVEGVGDF